MSIASRITAIEEHIRDVYDTIDYSYDTTGVDKNIINIPQNIFNGYINVLNDNGQSLWNALEKVSQADITEAELSNVVTAPMKIDLKGNTSQEADPTPDTPIPVQVVTGENVVSVQGENLVDIEGIELNPVDIRNYEQGNNYIKVTTKAVAWANITFRIFLEAGTYYYKHYAFLDSEKINTSGIGSLRISPSGGGTAIVNQSVAGEYLDKINDITFTIEKSGIYVFIYRCANGRDNVRILNINDIILSKTSTDFVPYSKTDYPINLGDIELCKINTYKDFPFKAINGNEYYDTLTEEQKNALVYGKWYVHKEIGKVVLNGSENWADRQQGSATYLYLKCTLQNGANGGISNKFKYNQSYNAPEEHILVSNEWKEVSIVIRKDRLSTPNVANFKSWLSNNNVTLYYVLATPTEEEITNSTLIEQLEVISKAKSVKDKTYITQTNDELPFILDVEAIKEYEVN